MRITHRTAQRAADAASQPRINTLRVEQNDAPFSFNPVSIQEIDREELEKFIKMEFEGFFAKFDKLTKLVEKFYITLEETEGLTLPVRRLSSALDDLEHLSITNAKDANMYLFAALQQMPSLLVAEIFTEVCENPELCLESDMLF